jgi:hypothetical protein
MKRGQWESRRLQFGSETGSWWELTMVLDNRYWYWYWLCHGLQYNKPLTVSHLKGEEKRSMGIKTVAVWIWNRLLMGVDNGIGQLVLDNRYWLCHGLQYRKPLTISHLKGVEKRSMGIKTVAVWIWNRLLMGVDNGTGQSVLDNWYWLCYDKSWYQLKHGLLVWAICLRKSEIVARGPSKLAKQSNNQTILLFSSTIRLLLSKPLAHCTPFLSP